MKTAEGSAAKTFLVVTAEGRGGRGARVLDLRREYDPLIKELAFRALARHPRLAGRPWSLRCRLEDTDSPLAAVLLEAHAERKRLAAVAVPIGNFRWIAQKIAVQLGLQGGFSCEVGVLDADHPAVAESRVCAPDDDIEFIDEEPELRLPEGAVFGRPPWPCRTISAGEGWVRCVFRASALREYLRAARAETKEEKAWLGLGAVYLSPESCSVVIEELMGPLPAASAGIGHLRTLGRDVARAYAVADRRVAYLHTHPRKIEGAAMSPDPSTNDHELAWDFDRASRLPSVFPIALFGHGQAPAGGDVAAHGYDRGVLGRVTLEVARDE